MLMLTEARADVKPVNEAEQPHGIHTDADVKPVNEAEQPHSIHADTMLKFGVKAGSNAAVLMRRGLLNDQNLWRTRFDLYGEYRLNNALGVQLSLLYLGQGEKLYIGTGNYLDYLLCSPSLRWYPGSDRQFCLFIGPQLSYLIAAREDSSSPNISKNLLQGPDGAQRRRVDAGLLFGLDYEFDIHLLLGLSWNVGFINLARNLNPPATNISSSLHLGYNFAPLLL